MFRRFITASFLNRVTKISLAKLTTVKAPLMGLGIVLLAMGLPVSTASAEPVLDQDQSVRTGGACCGVAQSFTVGISGKLSSIEVSAKQAAAGTADLVLTVIDGLPGVGAVLATSAVPRSAVPTSGGFGFVAFDLTSADISVSVGDVLSFIIGVGSQYNAGITGDVYAGGTEFSFSGGWFPINADVAFRTFVEVELAPAAGTPAISNLAFNGTVAGFSSAQVVGWEFSTNNTVTVTALGFLDIGSNGLAAAHEVGLWDSAGTLLASAEIP